MHVIVPNNAFQYHRALLQTFALGLLICCSWLWLFRDEHATYGSLSEALRYNTWSEGFRLWLVSLDMGPWLLAACMIMPVPLVVASKGGRFLAPGIIATGYLVGMMWITDFWGVGNTLESWFWTPGLFRLIFLFMPVTSAFMACDVVPNLYSLVVACAKQRERARGREFSSGDGVKLLVLLVLNLACVFAAILMAKCLKRHELGPFFKGFWHGSGAFLNAPSCVFRVCANSPSSILLTAWLGSLLAVAFLVFWRSGEPREMLRFLSVGLAFCFLSVVWLAGDLVVNYGFLLGDR